ncbi:PAS domain S-box protein [Rhodoflexus sp.]
MDDRVMTDLDEIAVDKEVAEIRLLPLVLVVIIWGINLLPHQQAEVRFGLALLVWMPAITLALSASTFFRFFRHEHTRRNLLMVYQALLLPGIVSELFSHSYHPLFLLIYLCTVAMIAFVTRHSRIRLLIFLVAATLLIFCHPLFANLQIEQIQTWQVASMIICIWNAALFVISSKVRDRQISQTRRYLQTIDEAAERQRVYAEQLHIERLHLRNIIDNIDLFVALVDKNGIVMHINQPFIDYIGSHGVSADLLGKSISSIAINEERKRQVEEYIAAALQGQTITGELYNDYLSKYLTLRYCPIKDHATGETYGVGIYYRDVTESYEAQQQLRYSNKQLRAILDSMDRNVYLTDRQGRMINANKCAYEGRFGLKPAPPIGELLSDNIEEPENRKNYLRNHAKAAKGKSSTVDYYIEHLKVWMQVQYMPAYDQEGAIFGVIITVTDISLQKQSEETLLYALKRNKAVRAKLKEREIMYRQLLDASADQIALKDVSSNYLWMNRRFKEFYGDTPMSDTEFQGKEQAEDNEVLTTQLSGVYEYWACNLQGENHLLRTIKAPIRDKNGNIDKIAVFSTDITEQNERIRTLEGLVKAYQELSEQERAKERALSESQATIQLLAENTSELIALTHANGTFKYVSPSAEKLIGFKPEEMIGRSWGDFFHLDDLLQMQEMAERMQATNAEHTLTHRIRTSEGRYLWLETIWKYIFDEQQNIIGIQTSSRNITDRMAAEQAIQALVTRYQTLFDASYDAILILKTNPLDPVDLQVEEANAAAQELLGYSLDELKEINILTIEEKISWHEMRKRIHTFISQRRLLLETRVRKRSGEWVWVEIVIVPFRINQEDYLQFTLRDISLRRQVEEVVQAKAVAEKSLEFKSSFLAKMSHEIRTPMNGLQGLTHMLLRTELNERQKHIVESIQNSTKGLLTILNDILDLSKLEAGKLALNLAPMDVRRCIAEVKELFSAVALEKNLVLEDVIATNLPATIVSDYNRLRQVINNLVSNAIKFTDQGSVTITAEIAESFDDYDLLRISIRDTGIGIDAKSFKYLFETFYQGDTSKGLGTGLGLAICKELVELLGGKIDLQSTPGQGSLFWFTFKAWRTSEVQLPPAEVVRYVYRARQPVQILLAEDVAVNQEIVKWMLEEIGAQVTVAENGLIAYEYARQTTYDLIIMDINMPVMDGITATRHIKAVASSSVPVIGVSAHAMAGDADTFIEQGMDAYLTKPIDPDALYEMIYRFLPERIERIPMLVAQAEAGQTSAELPLMNPAVVAHIKKLAGSQTGMLQGLLESFITDIGQLREKIGAAHAQAKAAEMVSALHTLKGLCGTIGASRLFECASATYAQASSDPRSITQDQLNRLFQLIDATTEAVHQDYFVNMRMP